jgi:hypothetical protein
VTSGSSSPSHFIAVGVSKRSFRSNPFNTAGLIPEMGLALSTLILDWRSLALYRPKSGYYAEALVRDYLIYTDLLKERSPLFNALMRSCQNTS